MNTFYRLLKLSLWTGAWSVCMAGFAMTSFYLYLKPNLPEVSTLRSIKLQTPLRIYTRDGMLIGEYGEKKRTPIDIETVPEQLIKAFVAAEDNRFYSHNGIDFIGLLRAFTQLVSTGSIQTGGSTITMQVAKNYFLTRDRTFIRKFNEILLAIQIESELSKGEILELYLNKIYLGNRAYGVNAAAQVYYGKRIDELTLDQMAMIAGLPKAPSRYNPIVNPSRAKIRRDWILDRMKDLEMIDETAHNEAQSALVSARYHGNLKDLSAPYAAELARQEMLKRYGREAYTEGYRVTLTVDSKNQVAADTALKNGLEAYDKRHGYRGPLNQSDLDLETLEEMERNELLNETLQSYPVIGPHFPAFVLSVENKQATLWTIEQGQIVIKLEDALWARPLITVNRRGPEPEAFSDIVQPGHIITVRFKDGRFQLSQIPAAQSALASVSAKDGAIEALVGGYDFAQSKYNRATQAKRQPGSNFKPFVYLAALQYGASASTLINDAPLVFEDQNLEDVWRPENSSGKFYGPTRIRKALYNSRNLVSIRLLKQTGIRKTIDYVSQFGYSKDELPADLSLALGSAGLTPLDIAQGYAMIANGGYYVEPYIIAQITDESGEILYEADPLTVCESCEMTTEDGQQIDLNPAPRIAEERAIYIMHSMLKDVITKGTGRRALVMERDDIAGKTGTTNDQKDAWFSGFNAEIATAVWFGFDEPETLGRNEFGAKAALPIWIEYMRTALDQTESAHMAQPPGIVSVRIDPDSGLLASPETKGAIFELFREEYAPQANINSTRRTNTTRAKEPLAPEDIF